MGASRFGNSQGASYEKGEQKANSLFRLMFALGTPPASPSLRAARSPALRALRVKSFLIYAYL